MMPSSEDPWAFLALLSLFYFFPFPFPLILRFSSDCRSLRVLERPA
jgi:hypothetical protein